MGGWWREAGGLQRAQGSQEGKVLQGEPDPPPAGPLSLFSPHWSDKGHRYDQMTVKIASLHSNSFKGSILYVVKPGYKLSSLLLRSLLRFYLTQA